MGNGGQQQYTPPAVVTGIPANMAGTPEGMAAASGVLPMSSLSSPQMAAVMSPSALSLATPLQTGGQLVGGFSMGNGMQAAAAAAAAGMQAAASQLGGSPAFSLEAQQAAVANLAELQQQVTLSTMSGSIGQHLQQQQQQQQAAAAAAQQQQAAVAQHQHQQQQQQAAQAAIWS